MLWTCRNDASRKFHFVLHRRAAVLLASILWWKDVVDESKSGKFHNKVVQIGLRYGMILFIASEVMFFSAWFWAFFDVAFYPGQIVQS